MTAIHDDATQVAITLNTPYVPQTFVYSVSGGYLPYIKRFVLVKVQFKSPTTVTVSNNVVNASYKAVSDYNGPSSAGWPLYDSSQIPLMLDSSTSDQTIRIESSLDGVYQITILRRPPDLQAAKLNGFSTAGGAINTPSSIAITPVYTPGTLGPPYLVKVANAVNLINLQLTFSVVGSIGITLNSGTKVTVTTSPSTSQNYSLVVGMNDFKVDSTQDGVYFFRVERYDTTVTKIELFGIQNNANQVTVPFSAATCNGVQSTAFCLGRLVYSASVNFIVNYLSIRVTFTGGAVDIYTVSTATTVSVTSGTTSAQSPLAITVQTVTPAKNEFHVISTTDGTFTITVERGQPDVTFIKMMQDSTQVGFSGSSPITRYEPIFGFYLIDSLGEPTTTRNPNNDQLRYQIEVAKYVGSIQWSAQFSSSNTVTLDNKGLAWGTQSYASIRPSTRNALTQVYAPNYYPFTLESGMNILRLDSTADGLYTFEVYRSLGDIIRQSIIGVSDINGYTTITDNSLKETAYLSTGQCNYPAVPYYVTKVTRERAHSQGGRRGKNWHTTIQTPKHLRSCLLFLISLFLSLSLSPSGVLHCSFFYSR